MTIKFNEIGIELIFILVCSLFNMENNFEDLKKLKVFDEFFMAISNDKIVFKDLNKPNEHHTMQIRKDGILDVHKKTEKPTTEYESLIKIDLGAVAKEMEKIPNFEKKLITEIFSFFKEVDFTEDEFANRLVANIKTPDEIQKFVEKKGGKYNIPLESIKKLDNNDIFTWKEAKNKVKTNASVFDNGQQIGNILKINNKFYFVNLDLFENTSLAELLNEKTVYDGSSIENKAP